MIKYMWPIYITVGLILLALLLLNLPTKQEMKPTNMKPLAYYQGKVTVDHGFILPPDQGGPPMVEDK